VIFLNEYIFQRGLLSFVGSLSTGFEIAHSESEWRDIF